MVAAPQPANEKPTRISVAPTPARNIFHSGRPIVSKNLARCNHGILSERDREEFARNPKSPAHAANRDRMHTTCMQRPAIAARHWNSRHSITGLFCLFDLNSIDLRPNFDWDRFFCIPLVSVCQNIGCNCATGVIANLAASDLRVAPSPNCY